MLPPNVADEQPALLDRLEGVKPTGGSRWQARCPAHADRNPSLSVCRKSDGTILLKCHAGCSARDVVSALGMTLADLFPRRNGHSGNGRPRIVATYDYRNEGGKLLFQVCRFEPKDFRQRRPDGTGGWTWNLKGVRRTLYRLPELLAADPAQPVFVCEGERDVDQLGNMSLVATCNSGGAGKWQQGYSEMLRGRHVIVIADNDDPGRNHAEQVARSLHGVAAGLRVCELPAVPPGGDVTDWLADNGQASDLLTLADETPEWLPPAGEPQATEPQADKPEPQVDNEHTPEPIEPVSIRSMIAAHPRLRQPVIDGLLRRGETANIIASPKRGKSWLAYGLALSLASGRDWLDRFATTAGRVCLFDNELHVETIAHRIPVVADAMKIFGSDYYDMLDVVSLRGRLTDYHGIGQVVKQIKAGEYSAIIIDAHYRMLTPGVSENDNAAMAGIYNLIDQYAATTDAVWLLIHHTSKGSQSEKMSPTSVPGPAARAVRPMLT